MPEEQTIYYRSEEKAKYEPTGKNRLISREIKTYKYDGPENPNEEPYLSDPNLLDLLEWELAKKELISGIIYRCDDIVVRRKTEIWEYDKEITATALRKPGGEPLVFVKRQTKTEPPFSRNDLKSGEEVEGEHYTETAQRDFYTKIEETWEEKKRDRWEHITKTAADVWELVAIGGAIYFSFNPLIPNYKDWTVGWRKRVEENATKDDQAGPAPEFRPSYWDFESQERQSELVRAPGRLGTRVKRIVLPFPTGATRTGTIFDPCSPAADIAADCEVHLLNWATLWDKLLNNQSKSRQFIVPYSDKIRQNYRPFQVFTAQHMASDGTIVTAKYMINGFSLSLSPTECLCLIDGIWLEDIGD
ncbi:MAG: hypothetical protein ONB11_12540 [candidate division KSB1 bacterium]|nr:hypothetical protein [candidate division KSB1 bacterium]